MRQTHNWEKPIHESMYRRTSNGVRNHWQGKTTINHIKKWHRPLLNEITMHCRHGPRAQTVRQAAKTQLKYASMRTLTRAKSNGFRDDWKGEKQHSATSRHIMASCYKRSRLR